VWPQGVSWLKHETGVREARGGRVRDPAVVVADAVAAHLRERSGEPVQTDLAKRGWRWDIGWRCRAVHALWKPERPTISPAPMPMDTGTASALGWINLPTLLLRRFASFDSRCCSRSGDPEGDTLRVPVAVGFILALTPWWANPPADAGVRPSDWRRLTSQGTDSGRVNYERIGDVQGVPASSRSPNSHHQQRLHRTKGRPRS